MTSGAGDSPVFLIGGGRDPGSIPTMYGALLRAAGPMPTIACIVLDDGDGLEQFQRWTGALQAAGACIPMPVIVARDDYLDRGSSDDEWRWAGARAGGPASTLVAGEIPGTHQL